MPAAAKKKQKQQEIAGPVELGDRVRYKIVPFEGIVDAIMDHLYQCRQVHIIPETLDKDGNTRKGEWVDEPWVEILAKGVHKPMAAVEAAGERVSGAPNRRAVEDLRG